MKSTQHVIMVLASREAAGAPAGGIHKAVLAHIAALHAHGIQVHLLTASVPCAESARKMGAETDVSPIWHNATKPLLFPTFWRKLLRLRRLKPRCVIHHSGRTWAWGNVFFPGVPHVQVFHREIVRPYRFFRRWLALSPGFAEVLRRDHSLGGLRKVAWAPNGLIDPPPPPPPPRASPSPFVIGFIGRSGPGKGIRSLLEAAARLVAGGENVVIRFAGDGGEMVAAEAERLSITPRVEFTGWHPDLTGFIDAIDLLVLPSTKESFGLVIIEAMARARPVLVTDCHGPASIVVDGETGYLVPIGDTEALTRRLREAIHDPDRVAKGLAGYERVMEEYLPRPVGEKLISALTELGARIDSPARTN